MNKILKNKKGFTLLEVLISVVITGIVTASILQLYVTQHENYIIQDDITDIQQNARASIDQLSRQIRMAGYEIPIGINGIEAYDTNPDTIVLTYHTSGCDTYLSSSMATTTSDLVCGSAVSCFSDGRWVFIYDADSAKGEWFQISGVLAGTFQIQHSSTSFSRKYNTNSLVLAMTQIKFYVDNTTDVDHPKLMLEVFGQTPQVYSDNVYDLQFQYILKNGMTVDVPPITENIREVQMSISARSNNPELSDNGNESYRDRTFTTSVFLRNFGI